MTTTLAAGMAATTTTVAAPVRAPAATTTVATPFTEVVAEALAEALPQAQPLAEAERQTILTTVVGSYPTPEWLRVHPTRDGLRDATLVVVRTQELAGIDVLSDGELSRFDVNHPETNGMIDYFVGQMDGVSARITAADAAAFSQQQGMGYRAEPAGVVTGPLGEGTLNLQRAAQPLRVLTTRRAKFTVTSPYMLAKVLLDRHYRDRQALGMALAEVLRDQVRHVDADVIQVDEANVAGAPQDGPAAAELINVVLDGVPEGRGRAVHVCFGNYGGQTVQVGYYEQLVRFMNLLHADHVVLEFARRGYGELQYLKELDPRIGVGLGVIDIKDLQVESPEQVARRLEHAERVLGPGRVRYANPDCGMWMLPRSVADAKLRALARGRDQYLGRETKSAAA